MIAAHSYFLGPFRNMQIYEYPSSQTEELKENFKYVVSNKFEDDEIKVVSIMNESKLSEHKNPKVLSFVCTPH